MEIDKFILIAISFLVGVAIGEHKTCTEIRGEYSWDFGSCKVQESK